MLFCSLLFIFFTVHQTSSQHSDDCMDQLSHHNYCISRNDRYDDPDVNAAIKKHINDLRPFNESETGDIAPRKIPRLHENRPACSSRPIQIRPIRAKNEHGVFRKILNSADFFQFELVDVCENPDYSCRDVMPFVEHETICKQLHTFQKLVALDTETGKLVNEKFLMPSGCACHVRKKAPLAARFHRVN